MKCRKFIFTFFIMLFLLEGIVPFGGIQLMAQNGYKEFDGKLMPYIVEGNDTVFLSPIAAARVYEKKT